MARSLRGNLSDTVRITFVLFLIIMFVFALFSCESPREIRNAGASLSPEQEAEKKILKERLTFMLRNIEHFQKLDHQPVTNRDAGPEDHREMLTIQRSRASAILNELRSATGANWATVSASARETLDGFRFSLVHSQRSGQD